MNIAFEKKLPLQYCCPECDYQILNYGMFSNHALENHVKSLVLFGYSEEKDEETIDVKPNDLNYVEENLDVKSSDLNEIEDTLVLGWWNIEGSRTYKHTLNQKRQTLCNSLKIMVKHKSTCVF